jgi:nitric oxide reductase NorD protein
MARQRPALAVDLRAALARHETAAFEEREAWAAALLELANVNAGPAALLAAFRATIATYPKPGVLRRLAVSIAAATDVCRAAGASAARLSLEARAQLADRFERGAWGPEAAWWRGLLQLARDDGALIATAVASSAEVLAVCGTEGFDIFVTTALRASRDRLRRASFLSLADPEARRVLDRLAGRSTFSASQRTLAAYARALWGAQPVLRAAAGAEGTPAPRRTTFAHGIIFVPETFSDVPPHRLPDLFRAAVAHIGAHGAYASPLRDPGKLKPAQITLVGLIEDARIEALAMRRFPGLRQVWAPFHTARPSILRTAPELFARLAHALFDPAHEDADSFIAKARGLFAAEPDLADSELSRRIGGLLGNDIGQMRIPFNPKTFVIEPAYRDDNLGFWVLPPADQAAEDLDTTIEALRRTSKSVDDPDEADRSEAQEEPDRGAGRARAVASEDDGVVVARYPEWDRAAGLERPDWTTVREIEPAVGPPHSVEEAMARDPGLIARIDRLVRAARVGRATRLKRQPEGLELDLDAAIDAATALRTGEIPDERIHVRKVMRLRDLAVIVLIDTSESTRDAVAGGRSVLDVEKHAVAALAHAMGSLGDAFALMAFASVGREDVRVARVKDFGQTLGRAAMSRLAGLSPGYSTRLGAALRHAGAELRLVSALRRLILVLTDGAPSDIDVADPLDLVDDARRAVLGLKSKGIDAFGLTLDPNGEGAGAAVFGRSNHLPVRRIEDLPRRLSELYFRIARR